MDQRLENAQDAAQSAVEERHRVHHSYVWLGSLRMVAIIFFAMAVSLLSSLVKEIAILSHGGDGVFIVMVIAFACLGTLVVTFGIVLLVHWLSYKHLYYVIGPSEFSLYKGVLNKTRVHVPYNKVQSVDQKASVLQRIVGVRTLYIDTAGGANNKAIVVPYLTKRDAEWLRAELFARKSGRDTAPDAAFSSTRPGSAQGNLLDVGQQVWDEIEGAFGGESFADVAPSFEFGLTNKELVFAALSNRTSFAVILFGFVAVMSQVISGLLDLFPEQGDQIGSMALDAGAQMIGYSVLALVVMTLLLMAFIWVISVIGTCVSYGGFKATRRGSRIEVQHGMLQHVYQGVDIDRVQAVAVKQSFIRRFLGYCEISLAKVDAASEGDANNGKKASQGIVVHPFVKVDQVPAIIAGLIPEFDACFDVEHPAASVALRRAIVRRCVVQGVGFWLALVTLVAQLTLGTRHATDLLMLDKGIAALSFDPVVSVCTVAYVVAALVTIISAVSAVLWARGSSFSYDERFTRIVNGGFSITATTIPRRKIQFGYLKSNPLQRHVGTVTLNARTAAGIGGTTVTLVDASRDDGEAWLEWLEPHGV